MMGALKRSAIGVFVWIFLFFGPFLVFRNSWAIAWYYVHLPIVKTVELITTTSGWGMVFLITAIQGLVVSMLVNVIICRVRTNK